MNSVDICLQDRDGWSEIVLLCNAHELDMRNAQQPAAGDDARGGHAAESEKTCNTWGFPSEVMHFKVVRDCSCTGCSAEACTATS